MHKKAPWLIARRMSLTLHLLLFEQSIGVLTEIVLMYLILLQGKIYAKENQVNEMLGLCLFS